MMHHTLPNPFQFVAASGAADGPAAEPSSPPVMATAAGSISSSDGGLRAGDVTQTIGSAVTDAPECSGDTISPTVLLLPSEAYHPPAGYVLIERELLGRVVKRLKFAAARERQALRGAA